MKKINWIMFRFPGGYENNYEPQAVVVKANKGFDWTPEDIKSHLRIAGFTPKTKGMVFEAVMAAAGPYDDPNACMRISREDGEYSVTIPLVLYEPLIADYFKF